MKLIDKSTLAAGIEKLKSNLIYGACASQIAMETRCKEEAYNEVLSFLDTFEVKEVDLETFDKRVTKMWGRCAANPNDTIACLHIDSFIEIARHFYELGLKTGE